MIDGKTVLAIIPARGGSKGIPRKNIALLAGKPLIVWTIEAAHHATSLDRVILSSEDPEIIAAAKAHACEVPFVRPQELARDDTPGIEPVLHAIHCLPEHYDYVVLLQPTSPLRTSDEIDECLKMCIKKHAPACVSVTAVEQHPYIMYSMYADATLRPVIQHPFRSRRQALPQIYILNGAIYCARTPWILAKETFLTDETCGYVMPREHSVDIDTPFDLHFAEFLLTQDQRSS